MHLWDVYGVIMIGQFKNLGPINFEGPQEFDMEATVDIITMHKSGKRRL